VIQGTGYDGSATTQFANLPLNGSGFILSLEAGYPFPFPWLGPTFVLELQVKSSGWSFRSARPTTAWVRSASVPSQALPAGWVCAAVDVRQRRRNGMAALLQANIWRDWGAEATTAFGSEACR
jgi:hypothetical protein